MARSLEPLVVGRVIGDVVDMFGPAAEFTVHYGPKQITNGCEIKPSDAVDKPKIQILGPHDPSNHYTLVCFTNFFIYFFMTCQISLIFHSLISINFLGYPNV